MNAIKEPANQPRFKDASDCFFKPLLEDQNGWHFVELQERVGTDEDEVDEERQLVLRHVTTSVARSIEVGSIGAFAFEQGVTTNKCCDPFDQSQIRRAERICVANDDRQSGRQWSSSSSVACYFIHSLFVGRKHLRSFVLFIHPNVR